MESLRGEIEDILIRDGSKRNDEYYMSDDELAGLILSTIEKRIDSLYPENPIDTKYKTGYYNAICKVKEMLKK